MTGCKVCDRLHMDKMTASDRGADQDLQQAIWTRMHCQLGLVDTTRDSTATHTTICTNRRATFLTLSSTYHLPLHLDQNRTPYRYATHLLTKPYLPVKFTPIVVKVCPICQRSCCAGDSTHYSSTPQRPSVSSDAWGRPIGLESCQTKV